MDYSSLTDRSRIVMQLANQEAQRFNHEWVGTEHVLIALIKEDRGVAANVLKNLGVDLRKIRLEVEKLVQGGPEMITMGKLPQTPRLKKAIEYAMEEVSNLHHRYVGTEHILLGLLRDPDGVPALVLVNLGLKLEDVRKEVLALLGVIATHSETAPVNWEKPIQTKGGLKARHLGPINSDEGQHRIVAIEKKDGFEDAYQCTEGGTITGYESKHPINIINIPDPCLSDRYFIALAKRGDLHGVAVCEDPSKQVSIMAIGHDERWIYPNHHKAADNHWAIRNWLKYKSSQ